MANEKISEYINTRNTLADGDLFDVSAFLNPGFESQKVTYAIFKANLASAGFLSSGDNISLLNNDAGFVTSNITHIGEVTGLGTLTIDSTAITNKTTVTGVSGDFVLISDTSDGGNLKKVDVVDFLGGGADGNGIYDGSGTLQAGATTVGMSTTDTLTFGTDALHIENNSGQQRVGINRTTFTRSGAFEVNGATTYNADALYTVSGVGIQIDGTNAVANSMLIFNKTVANSNSNILFQELGVNIGAIQYDRFNNGVRDDGMKIYANGFATNGESIYINGTTDDVILPNGGLAINKTAQTPTVGTVLDVGGDTRIDGDLTVNVGAGTIFSITDSDDSFALG
jgi:hypothetical protein